MALGHALRSSSERPWGSVETAPLPALRYLRYNFLLRSRLEALSGTTSQSFGMPLEREKQRDERKGAPELSPARRLLKAVPNWTPPATLPRPLKALGKPRNGLVYLTCSCLAMNSYDRAFRVLKSGPLLGCSFQSKDFDHRGMYFGKIAVAVHSEEVYTQVGG